jgi:hypothetical protein
MALEGLSGKHCRESTVGKGLGRTVGRAVGKHRGKGTTQWCRKWLDDGGFSR